MKQQMPSKTFYFAIVLKKFGGLLLSTFYINILRKSVAARDKMA